MADDVRVAPDDGGRRRRLTTQPEPGHTQIQDTPDHGIEFLSPRPRHAERMDALLREEPHSMQLPAIGQHGKNPRRTAGVHDAAGAGNTGPAHIRPTEHLLDRPYLRGDCQWEE